MKRLIMLPVWFIVILLVILLVVPYFINVNNFKNEITQQVNAATGYNVALDGDLSLQLLPVASIGAQNVAVSSPVIKTNQPFAKMKSMDVSLQLMPLLKGNIQITEINLDGAALNLVKSSNTGNEYYQTWLIGLEP